MMIWLQLILVVQLTSAMPTPEPADIVWVAEGEFCEPETVLPLPDNTLLVSNVCGFNQQGNGFLTLLGLDGETLDWRVVDQLDAPLGMALVNDELFVIDGNRVRVFSWPDYKPIRVVDLSTKVANDIAVTEAGTIYVTDTAAGHVIRVRHGQRPEIFPSGVSFDGANGIAVNNDLLFVGGDRLWCVNLKTQEVTRLGPEWLRDIDGIEFESDGTLQVTPVGGPLVRLKKNAVSVLGGDGVSSANHGYAKDHSLVLIPTGFDNTVVAIRLPREHTQSSPSQ
ncbi:MAG: hypothetical protein AAF438_07220 [Pseudomonadota bacterium]